jgi:hypothetical protein
MPGRALLHTSVGVVEVHLAKGWASHPIVLYDEDGWERKDFTPDVEGEFEWTLETLAEKLIEVGVPADEAKATAERVWSEWLARGGGPMSRAENIAGGFGAVVLLIVLVGVWLVGFGFLVWLVVTRLV